MPVLIFIFICSTSWSLFAAGQVYDITKRRGIIESPNFPNNYPDHVNITWRIKAREGYRIRLYFSKFDLESSYEENKGPCVYDYVKVSEGSVDLCRFCGNIDMFPLDAPLTGHSYYSSGNSMDVKFVSDYSNEDPAPVGFRAVFLETDRNECTEMRKKSESIFEDWDKLIVCNHHCRNIPGSYYCYCDQGYHLHDNDHTCIRSNCTGEVISEPTGRITTARYPFAYSKYANCQWTLRGQKGKDNVWIRFVGKFSVEEHDAEGCVYDWVQYFTAAGSRSQKYCGSKLPNDGQWISMESHEGKVAFHSDLSVEKEGFDLRYKIRPVGCVSLQEDIPNGRVATVATDEYFELGDTLTIECYPGYRLEGRNVITCERGGVWSSIEAKCRTMGCVSLPEDVPNGRVTTVSTDEHFELGDTLTIECYPGYRLEGRNVVICERGGVWSSIEEKCRIKSCKYPEHLGNVPNGRIEENDISLQFGSTVTFRCFQWYEMISGTSVWGCGEDESWHEESKPVDPNSNKNIPVCKPICGLKGTKSILSGTFAFGDVLPREPDIEALIGTQIIEGRKAKRGEWPWTAFINLEGDGLNPNKFCGGSLISSKVVVTAAHCLHHALRASIRIFLGVHNRLDGINHERLQVFEALEVYIHPNYSKSTIQNDIAVFILNETAEIGKYVRPICIPRSNRAKLLPEKSTRKGIVVGWGVTDISTMKDSKTLQEVRLPLIEHGICAKHFEENKPKGYENLKITERVLCAGYLKGGRDSCEGDSGGPFMYWEKNTNKWFLNGVVSHGSTPSCGAQTFGVYTNVAKYIDWLKSFL